MAFFGVGVGSEFFRASFRGKTVLFSIWPRKIFWPISSVMEGSRIIKEPIGTQ